MSETMTGGCACGRVRCTAAVASDDAYLCQRRMCQKASGGVPIAFENLRKDAVRREREPDYFHSSAIARRGYCATCGTSLSFDYRDSDKMDLTVGSFDDPARFVPTHHFGSEALHRAWINTDGLREQRSDQYPALVERWMRAIGKLPD